MQRLISPLKVCVCLLVSLQAFPATGAEPAPIFPAALRQGDTIMFVAPAGELNEKRIQLAAKRLNELGFRTILPESLFRRRGYLAGTDEQRAAELMGAFTNPEVDAIFPGTGGYGVTRILDLLDWDTISKHPKILIGFSDITALHLALSKKVNWVTFHSPNPQWGLGSEGNLSAHSAKYFWRNLLASQNRGQVGFTYDQPAATGPLETVASGAAQGRLTGGNLSLVAALIGTPYEINTKGKVLFLEDVNEAPYRVDRMLRQLMMAGKFDAPAGVLLGQFSDSKPDEDEPSLSMGEVFADYFADAKYPVVANFATGHAKQNATLPLGALAEINADELSVRVLENPVATD